MEKHKLTKVAYLFKETNALSLSMNSSYYSNTPPRVENSYKDYFHKPMIWCLNPFSVVQTKYLACSNLNFFSITPQVTDRSFNCWVVIIGRKFLHLCWTKIANFSFIPPLKQS